jgi:hypothetical protein
VRSRDSEHDGPAQCHNRGISTHAISHGRESRDIIYDEERIYGDGINIAARLEGIAEPGGVYVSRQAYEQVEGKLALSFRKLGLQTLKNIVKPVEVFAVDGIGEPLNMADRDLATMKQEIKYCRTPGGIRLAYATAGSGPPLVKAANWLNHLEYDWESPVWRHVVRGLARDRTLIRYDARGSGMSDWDVETLSLDLWVRDLETVVDAAGVDRFPLLGISTRLSRIHCLCCATPRTRLSSHSLWRLRSWSGKEVTKRERRSGGNDDADSRWVGLRQSCLPTDVYRAVHAGSDPRAG